MTNTFISIADVRVTESDCELAGSISFNWNGTEFEDVAYVFRDSLGRPSIAWRQKEGEKTLDSHFRHAPDGLAYREIERQVIEQVKERLR